MKDEDLDGAAIVALFYKSVFAPEPWIGLSERTLDIQAPISPSVSANAFGKTDLAPILPHLEQALDFATMRAKAENKEQSLALKIQDLPLPVIVVARNLEIISMTKAGRTLLAAEPLIEQRDSFLAAPDKAFQKHLGSSVAKALDSGENTVLARSENAPNSGMILMVPMPPDPAEEIGQHVALFFNFEFEDTDKTSPVLMTLHGLTLSEAEVVSHLIRGYSLEKISELKNTSIHTVRTHIKNVYLKTDTRRQGELISLVLSGPAMWLRLLTSNVPQTDKPDPSYPSSHCQMTLRDGRLLSYGDFGPRHGVPVILIHQLYGVRTEREKDDALLEDLNIRLVVPERPGVGLSSPHKGQCLEDWSKDIAELADRLDLERFCVAGISGGGPYAMACGVFLGDRVRKLGLIASDIPVDELPRDARIGLPRMVFSSMARHWPKGARALLEMRYRKMYEDPDNAIADFVKRGSAADKALLSNPDIYRICRRNLKEAGEVPRSVLSDELIMLSKPWGFSVSDLRTPTLLWHGRQDHYCPPEYAKAISDLISDSTLVIRDDWGHYFYYAHWKLLLTEIAR